jgi:hypothetical protein
VELVPALALVPALLAQLVLAEQLVPAELALAAFPLAVVFDYYRPLKYHLPSPLEVLSCRTKWGLPFSLRLS